ncbi:MAG TPA: protein kinase, partial [Ktedonobacteraceae bacterium]|nr:protein kinase [Ktedonobacteraceae bacterium]
MGEAEPATIGQYSIIRTLKDSARCRVYLGKRQGRAKDYLTIHVCLLPLATSGLQEAFVTRAKALKKLKHRQIQEVIDYGLLPGSSIQAPESANGYLVMRYQPGKTLSEQFPGERHRADEIKRLLSPLADALQYAHSAHITHGSLHPGQLLFDETGQLQLTGFAPLPPEMLPADAIETAALPYMAPEQLAGSPGHPGHPGQSTPASDQYALAVMVYEWLCGKRPYSATEREALAQAQRDEPLPAPRSLRDDLSPTVEAVLLKALSYQPEQRFPHVQAFSYEYLRALMGFPMSEFSSAKPIPTPSFTPVTPVTPIPPVIPVIQQAQTRTQPKSTRPIRRENEDAPFVELRNDTDTTSIGNSANSDTPDTPGTAEHIAAPDPHDFDDSDLDDYVEGENEDSEGRRSRRKPRLFAKKPNPHLLEDVVHDLSEGGVLSQRLDGYEERSAQVEMAIEVAKAIMQEQHALLEASTGTGKSLAYLLPIVRSGKGAIISTANKALQEQLYFKDIPFLQKNVQKFDAALVKGVANYICRKRLAEEYQPEQERPRNPELSRLWHHVQEFQDTIIGDFETLNFTVPPEVRGKVAVDSDQCAWSKCPFYRDCYVRAMRFRAERSQIVVVNHTLLLLDAAAMGYILPQREIIVIDEAHHLEEEASRSFTVSVNQSQVRSLLALKRLRDHTDEDIYKEAEEQVKHTWQRLEQVAHPGYKGRINLREPLQEGLTLASIIDDVARSLEKRRPIDMLEDDEVLYDKLITRTRNLAAHLRLVFSVKDPQKYVYYVSLIDQRARRNNSALEVSAAPLDITGWMRERLFNETHVIATSATLTTVASNPINEYSNGPTFDYFRQRVGLDREHYEDVQEHILPLSFDYEHNALLYLPRHLPMPAYGESGESSGYMKAIADEMMRLVATSGGRAFLLFSSKRMLDSVWNEFMTRLPFHLDLRLLRQGEMSRIELVRTFREAERAVLFGLKSFWEGV